MTRVAFASDFHIDVNRQNIIEPVKDYLKKENVDILCFAGDMSANISKSIRTLREIQEEIGIQVAAVPGNHEMWDESYSDSFAALEDFDVQGKELSVRQHPLEFGDWVILGNMGWYDYSTAQPYFHASQLDKMSYGGGHWNDKHYCNWKGKTNPEVANELLQELKEQLKVYQNKQIILLSHIVPYQACVQVKYNKQWDYFNAFIGNVHIGKLADEYQVHIAHFGHTHTRYSKRSQAGVEMVCTPLGYYGEWSSISRKVEEELHYCIPVYDL